MSQVVKKHDGWLMCWIWTGTIDRYGYGQFWSGDQRNVGAHRWSYEHFVGPVPEGMQLDHFKCWNRACVNPHHVRPATPAENIRNGKTHNSVKTHCNNGHPLSGINLYVRPDGARGCRKCRSAADKRFKQRRRQAA